MISFGWFILYKAKYGKGTAATKAINQEFLQKYEIISNKPIGAGECATIWKTKLKDGNGEVLIAKIFHNPLTIFSY